MNYKNDIVNKILSLGGTQKNPLCEDLVEDQKKREEGAVYIEKVFEVQLPSVYKFFYNLYGAFSFKNRVQIIVRNINKSVSLNGRVSVDYFYSLAGSGRCSVGELLSNYADQLKKKLLPICDGESGDLICIDLSEKTYGRIYYWFHEGDYGNDLFLIAEDIYAFIMALEIYIDNTEDSIGKNRKSNYTLTPEMLALLRKSGYGPKE